MNFRIENDIVWLLFLFIGSSKKSAKLGASKSAIAALGNPNGHNNGRTENSLPKYSPNVIPPISSGLPQTLADQISK